MVCKHLTWMCSSAECYSVVCGLLSRSGVCPGSANRSRLVPGSWVEEVGIRKARETGAQSLWPLGGGVDGRKCRAAGEVGAPVQVSGSPSSLTNFEIDLRPPFPQCTGAQAEKGLVFCSSLTPASNYWVEQSCYLIKPPYKTISLIVSFAWCRYKLAH